MHGIAAGRQCGNTLLGLLGIGGRNTECKLVNTGLEVVEKFRQVSVHDSVICYGNLQVVRTLVGGVDRTVVVGTQALVGTLDIEFHGEFRDIGRILLQRERTSHPGCALERTALNRNLLHVVRREVDFQFRTGNETSVDNLLGIEIRVELNRQTGGSFLRRSRHTLLLIDIVGCGSVCEIDIFHHAADLRSLIVDTVLVVERRQFVERAGVVVTGQQRLAVFGLHIDVEHQTRGLFQQIDRKVDIGIADHAGLRHGDILIVDREELVFGIHRSGRLFDHDFQIVVGSLHLLDCLDAFGRREIEGEEVDILLIDRINGRFDVDQIASIVFNLVIQRYGRRGRFATATAVVAVVLLAG